MISGIFRSTIWHQTIPDEMRGRLAGIEMLSYSLGPLGGQARSGLVADLTRCAPSIVSGGVLCVIGVGATAAWLSDFWRYDSQTDEHAVRERTLRADRAAAERPISADALSRGGSRRGTGGTRRPPGATAPLLVARWPGGSRSACRSRCARSRR